MTRRAAMALMIAVSTQIAHAQSPARTVGEDATVCKSRDTLNKLIDLKIQKDQIALGKLSQYVWATGECRLFKRGDEVFIEEQPFLSGTIRVRRKGDVESYWLIYDSLRKPGER